MEVIVEGLNKRNRQELIQALLALLGVSSTATISTTEATASLSSSSASFSSLFQQISSASSSSENLREFLVLVQSNDSLVKALVMDPELKNILQSLQTKRAFPTIITILELVDRFEASTVPLSSAFFQLLCDWVASDQLQLSEVSCRLIEKQLTFSFEHLSVYTHYCSATEVKVDSTILLRYLTIGSKVLAKSDTHFQAIQQQTSIINTIGELSQNKNDVLVQIVAIELLRYFASTKSGLSYLVSSGLFVWLIAEADESFDHTSGETRSTHDPVVVAQCLREVSQIFFIAATNQLIDSNFWAQLNQTTRSLSTLSTTTTGNIMDKFLRTALSHMEGVKEETRLVGMHVLTDFTRSSLSALQMVCSDKTLLLSWCSLLTSGKTDIQAATLHSIARVLEHNYSSTAEQQQGETNVAAAADEVKLKLKLFQSVGEVKGTTTVSLLLRLAKQPIASVRHAALDVMTAICRCGVETTPSTTTTTTTSSESSKFWPVLSQLVLSTDFRVYVLDQESESTKQGREWKYGLIQALAQHQNLNMITTTTAALSLDNNNNNGNGNESFLDKLKVILKRGPHFIPAQQAELMTMEH